MFWLAGRATTTCSGVFNSLQKQPIDRISDLPPLPPVGIFQSQQPDRVKRCPRSYEQGERAEPAPKQRRISLVKALGSYEGQLQDRRSIADRVATYGLKVFCTDCGLQHRHRTGVEERLRNIASPCCGARMHPGRWDGWAAWRKIRRDLRREVPVGKPDGRMFRVDGATYMRGLDS